jgi:serine/threonine protein kinase
LPLSLASDWYSVGAILHELLTGETPFQGSLPQVLRDKQVHDPQAPWLLAEGVPKDLNRLRMDLLHRDPAARPDGHEVLRRLQTAGPGTAAGTRPSSRLLRAPSLPRGRLIGRAAHLWQVYVQLSINIATALEQFTPLIFRGP